jgi:hypothetical protein
MFTALIISERRRVSFSLSLLSLYALLHTYVKCIANVERYTFNAIFGSFNEKGKMRDIFSQGCDIQSTLLGYNVFCCNI